MTIEARDISFGFVKGQLILRGITAFGRAGRVTAIVGPNAVGKTTLLRVLAGLLRPTEGEVLLWGRELGKFSGGERAVRLGYVSQRPIVDAPFTVRDVVTLGGFQKRGAMKEELFESVVHECELSEVLDCLFHELSVGQQQRVSLGRALLQLEMGGEGKVLLLDEPMSAMDPKHVIRTGRVLRAVAARGTAVMVVLHDVRLACELADDVWVLSGGRLAASGEVGSSMTVELMEEVYGTAFEGREIIEGNRVEGLGVVEPRYGFKD